MCFHLDSGCQIMQFRDGVVDADAIEEEGVFAVGIVAEVLVEVDAAAEGEGDVAIEEGVLDVEGEGPGIVLAGDTFLVVDVADVGVTGVVLDVDASADGCDAGVAVHGVGLEGCHRVEREGLFAPVGMGLGDLILGALPVFHAGLHADAALEVQVPVGLKLGRGVGGALLEQAFVIGVVDQADGGAADIGTAVGLTGAAVADVPIIQSSLDTP